MGLVVGIVVAVVFVVALVGLYVWTRRCERDIGGIVIVALLTGLYVWTRRSERDFGVLERELTDEEKQTGIVQRGAAGNILGGMGSGG